MAAPTRVVLSDINSILTYRIQVLEDVMYRLRTTALTLEAYQKSKPIEEESPPVFEEEVEEQLPIESEDSFVDSSILSSNKLEDVLQRAKEIRNGLIKKAGSSSVSSSSSSKKDKTTSTKPISLSSYVKSTSGSSVAKKTFVTTDAADTSSVSSSASRKPPIPPSTVQVSPRRSSIVPPPPSAVYSFHADITTQLDFFRTHRPSSLNPVLKLCVTKELYVAQSKRLTKALGRPAHPQSMCYAVMGRSIVPDKLQNQPCAAKVNNVLVKLKESFQGLQKHFERHLKSRLERTSLSQLSASDREEVLLLWMKGQKLLQLHEHYCFKSKQRLRKPSTSSSGAGGAGSRGAMLSSTDVCQCETCKANRKNELDLAQLVQSVLGSTAYFCPLSAIPDNQNTANAVSHANSSSSKTVKVPKGVPAGLSEPEQLWYISNKRAVTAFHNAFDNNAKFLIESVCGQNELTQVVSRLKECSRSEINHRTAEKMLSTNQSSGAGSSVRAQWVEGLKMFKNVHCILTKEAQDDSTCVFLDKQQPST